MKYVQKTKGFTLIELLVVVAVIGILTSVVLGSLSSARLSARDSAVTSSLSSYATEAEMLFEGNFDGLCDDQSFDTVEEYIQSQGAGIEECEADSSSYRIIATIPGVVAEDNFNGEVLCLNSEQGRVSKVLLNNVLSESSPSCNGIAAPIVCEGDFGGQCPSGMSCNGNEVCNNPPMSECITMGGGGGGPGIPRPSQVICPTSCWGVCVY